MLWVAGLALVVGLVVGWVVGNREAEGLREEVRGLWADLRGEN